MWVWEPSWKGVQEAVDQEGFIGVFLGGFKASAVGISAALIFGYLASLIFSPKNEEINLKKYFIISTGSISFFMF